MVRVSSQVYRYIKLLVVCFVAIAVILTTPVTSAAASKASEITVYRDPSCSCCEGWMKHLTAQGFQPRNVLTSEIYTLKQQYGVPDDLASCHTAVINGYIIEGHVPAADIKRLLAEKPDVAGLTVPGMPIGTPGMESGDVREPFTVFSFDKQGSTKFKQYDQTGHR